MLAKLKCLRCSYQWEAKPEPTDCLRCGHKYVKWLNYEELREIWNKERARRGEELI